MKKLIATILIIVLLPIVALADLPDITGLSDLTDQELKDLISACSQELRSRATYEPDGILLFDQNNIKIYQTADAYISYGFLRIPVTIINENDHGVTVSIYNAVCNGWDIYSSGCDASENAKNKSDLTFSVDDAEVTSLDQIESLKYIWVVYNTKNYDTIYKQEEREEHRFW